jgi:hypothetical protein
MCYATIDLADAFFSIPVRTWLTDSDGDKRTRNKEVQVVVLNFQELAMAMIKSW